MKRVDTTFAGRTLNIDARPSDALNLAVRAHVPILVARSVMDSAGIIPEEDLQEGTEEKPAENGEEEKEEAGAEGGEEREGIRKPGMIA